MIEKLMMDCIMQQLHMLKKLEFESDLVSGIQNKVHGNGGIRKLLHM